MEAFLVYVLRTTIGRISIIFFDYLHQPNEVLNHYRR